MTRLAGWGLLLLASLPALACRYNVRDLGFFDLPTEAYRLCVVTASNTPPALLTELRAAVELCFQESNVDLEWLSPDDSRLGPGRPLEALGTNPPPAALLISPDGPALSIPLAHDGRSLPPDATNTLSEIVDSPIRRELAREVSRRFGVILLLEGTDTAANSSARQAVTDAIRAIRDSLSTLPKSIAEPPSLVTLAPTAFLRERILLWSLRLTPEPTAEPRAVVIYGKARWIGPLMKGREIAAMNLTRLFGVIGADCECGMDLSWTRGTSLPIRWGTALHQAATKGLGFDPLDPLVQIEAHRILDRFGGAASGTSRAVGATEPTRAATPSAMSTGARGGAALAKADLAEGSRPRWGKTWIVLGAFLVTVAALSALFWQRYRRRS